MNLFAQLPVQCKKLFSFGWANFTPEQPLCAAYYWNQILGTFLHLHYKKYDEENAKTMYTFF